MDQRRAPSRSDGSIFARSDVEEPMLTIRALPLASAAARSAGTSARVSMNAESWLVASTRSCPSAVTSRRVQNVPALLTSTSMAG